MTTLKIGDDAPNFEAKDNAVIKSEVDFFYISRKTPSIFREKSHNTTWCFWDIKFHFFILLKNLNL